MLQIDASTGGLIGDALCHVPYMDFLCRKHNSKALVFGLNPLVAAMLAPSYRFEFGPLRSDQPIIRLSINDAFGYVNQCHMAQAFFKQHNAPLPPMPMTLDLMAELCGLPPGLVVAPYSRSNSPDNNKFWPHERWLEVISALRKERLVDRVYVVGASGPDNPAPYLAAGVEPVFDRPLAQVLHLMRQAPLFMSVEGGLSHLAHYGGVRRHVMLYPGCLPQTWARNPYAVLVTAKMPINVQVCDMAAGARQVLKAR